MKISKAILCLAASPLAMFSSVANAQGSVAGSLNTEAADLFSRDQNTGVRERAHPEYEAGGIRLGAFLLYPRIDASVETNDNIYAAETGEQSDTIFRVAPQLSLNSNWSRHSLQLHARGDFQRDSDHKLENSDNFEAGGSLGLDIQRRWRANASGSHAELSEPREAQNTPFASAKPIQYTLDRFNVGTDRVFNRVKLSANLGWAKYNYQDGRTIGSPAFPSVVIDQDTRDRNTYDATLRADYAISPDTAVFLGLSANQRRYDIGSTPLLASRDSDGAEVLAGVDFQVSNLVTGSAAMGYLKQNFDDPSFQDISGLGAKVSLQWFPTQITTVTGTVTRTVEDSVVIGAGGFLSTTVSGQVDHELRRNIILTGQLGYSDDQFKGVDRSDSRWLGAVSGTYLVNRNLGIGLTYSYLDQSSSGLNRGREFTVQKAMVSLILQR